MRKDEEVGGVTPESPQEGRSATEGKLGAAADLKRWSADRKKEMVLRLLRGKPADATSLEVAVPIYKLE